MGSLAIHGGSPCIPPGLREFCHPLYFESLDTTFLSSVKATDYDGGGLIGDLESRFATWTNRTYSVTTNSGTSALAACYAALQLGKGAEVLVPAYTFFATVTPLAHLGCQLVPVDCGEDGNVCPDDLRRAATVNTKAIVITHMWGTPCDMKAVDDICSDIGCDLIEDASHAHGATIDGRMAGSFGTASAWSLGAMKLLSGGQGGIMTTNNDEVYQRAVLFSHYNRRSRRDVLLDHLQPFAVSGTGMNLRMHPYSAALIMQQMDTFATQLAERRETAQMLIHELSQVPGITVPSPPNNCLPAWYSFPLVIDSRLIEHAGRDRILEALHAEGAVEIDAPGATRPITDYDFIRNACRSRRAVNASRYFARLIKLPVWYGPRRHESASAYVAAIRKVLLAANSGQL